MSKLKDHLEAAAVFTSDASRWGEIAAGTRRWVREQAAAVRGLSPPERVRCYALVTNGIKQPHMVSIEFAAPGRGSYSITIFADGVHDVRGRTPRTTCLAGAIKLLTLLTDELCVPVRLQP